MTAHLTSVIFMEFPSPTAIAAARSFARQLWAIAIIRAAIADNCRAK
jgi:hypothetical protein